MVDLRSPAWWIALLTTAFSLVFAFVGVGHVALGIRVALVAGEGLVLALHTYGYHVERCAEVRASAELAAAKITAGAMMSSGPARPSTSFDPNRPVTL